MFARLLRNSLAAALIAGAAAPAAANDYVFPWSSQNLIPWELLAQLDCNGLWLARNEIYDRNGYIFQSARGRAAFGWDGWTRNPDFSQLEWQNITRIQDVERRNYCN